MNTQAELQQAVRELRWNLPQERLRHHCDVAIASCPALPCARGPDRMPTSLGESINLIRGIFAHEVLNIRYAIEIWIGKIGGPDRRPE
jgi:hypothetical protein